AARRKRYMEAVGLNEKDAVLLAADRETGDYFDALLTAGVEGKRAATLIEVMRALSHETGTTIAAMGVSPARVCEVAALVTSGKLAAGKETARAVIASLREKDRPAELAAGELGLIQQSDTGPIDAAIDALIGENPKSLQDFLGGKQQAKGSLVGMIMKKGKGF